jgi:hypothetical protein
MSIAGQWQSLTAGRSRAASIQRQGETRWRRDGKLSFRPCRKRELGTGGDERLSTAARLGGEDGRLALSMTVGERQVLQTSANGMMLKRLNRVHHEGRHAPQLPSSLMEGAEVAWATNGWHAALLCPGYALSGRASEGKGLAESRFCLVRCAHGTDK